MYFFRELVEEGSYDPGDEFQKALAWFCFSDLIKEELSSCLEQWNCHYIRKSEYSCVHGRPELLYDVFDNQGLAADSSKIDEIQHAIDDNLSVNDDEIAMTEYFEYISFEAGLSVPNTFKEAKQSFMQLKQTMHDLEFF